MGNSVKFCGMHELDIIPTLVGGLGAALLFGYATQRLGMSPIVGYLLAGVVIGPNSPGFTADTAIANQFAEVGIVLLMFGVACILIWTSYCG